MFHLAANAFGFEMRGFQLKVPFGGTVGVVDQHEMRIVLQAFGLEFHGAAVLLDKFRENKFQQFGTEWHPAKNIPRCGHIDAAMIARNGRDCG
jgi:hypothetical protein